MILHIINRALEPFNIPLPSPDCYPSPAHGISTFSFFPHLPQRHGPGRYEADQQTHTTHTRDDDCRKKSYGHPTLTPGIFTVYCAHGICCGFDILRSCESPRHPFEIFTTRFQQPPKAIVYDNACHLHIYCLNREPQRFQNTLFLVDRFHWRGHVGCSQGYCMDNYIHLRSLNSQVNEQANSGLQRIKGQLAYMSIDNFIFHLSLFLSLKNADVITKLDINRLCV